MIHKRKEKKNEKKMLMEDLFGGPIGRSESFALSTTERYLPASSELIATEQ